MHKLRRWLRDWVPLVSSFLECSKRHRVEALKELLLVLGLSLLPIWGGALYATATATNADYVHSVYQLIKNGELVLYSTSILAPIFYLVINEPVGDRQFPERWFQGIIVIILFAVLLILFSAYKTTNGTPRLFHWSIYLYLISVLLLYFATVFRNWMNDGPDIRQSEREFLDKFMGREE